MDLLTGLTRPRIAGAALVAALAFALSPPGFAATNWTIGLVAGSKGESTSQAVPAAPTATATCSLVALQITVNWTAVTHATSYTVWQSTTGANGTYSVAASGVTATTWTSPILVLGTYFYEVSANIGSNWVTARSAATAGHSITLVRCT
jgi:hypothetical protein